MALGYLAIFKGDQPPAQIRSNNGMSFTTLQNRQRRLNSQNKVMISQRAVDFNLWDVEIDSKPTWMERISRAVVWGAVIAFMIVGVFLQNAQNV
jgi:hypothetical protein